MERLLRSRKATVATAVAQIKSAEAAVETQRLPALDRDKQQDEQHHSDRVTQAAERERVDVRQRALRDREQRRPAEDGEAGPAQPRDQVGAGQAAFLSSRSARRRILPTLVFGSSARNST